MKKIQSKRIVFITGAFVSNSGWVAAASLSDTSAELPAGDRRKCKKQKEQI